MRQVTRNTKVGELEYPISFNRFDTLAEALAKIGKTSEEEVEIEAPQGALEAVLGVVNAAQEQGAKQGGKEMIRDAIEKAGADEDYDGDPFEHPQVQEAVEKHQKRAAEYVIGAPRGETGGLTKTKAREIGARLRDRLGDEELLKLAAEKGIDPAELGIEVESDSE